MCNRSMIGVLFGYAVHARGFLGVTDVMLHRLGRDCRCQRRGMILDAAARYVMFILQSANRCHGSY